MISRLVFTWKNSHNSRNDRKQQAGVFTWKARSWYCCFSLGPRAYHHSPRILLTVRLSWLGCRWCTRARWRLLKIMKAFMGRRMWSFSLWWEGHRVDDQLRDLTDQCLLCQVDSLTFLSPSLGSALRDCVRLFMGPAEGAGSLATPGENLRSHREEKWNWASVRREKKGNRSSPSSTGG